MLAGKGFVSFSSIQEKDELFIDDRLKKTAKTLCIKFLKILLLK
ncbi:MAG: hypothetical protein ACTS73_01075 [Arsenophonus sp. NEOnobi-MAG3]